MVFSRISLLTAVLSASLVTVLAAEEAVGAGTFPIQLGSTGTTQATEDRDDFLDSYRPTFRVSGDPVSVSIGIGIGIGGKGGEPKPTSASGSPKEMEAVMPSPESGERSSSFKIIQVVVGSTVLNKSLVFTPADIKASPSDIIQFQFSQVNHTVTQSTFSEPCLPIQQSNTSTAGVHSGFIPVTAGALTVQTFDVPINDTMPMFIYRAQGPHCQLGMVMVVNAAEDQNLAAYKALAAKAKENIPAKEVRDGVLSSIPVASAAKPPV